MSLPSNTRWFLACSLLLTSCTLQAATTCYSDVDLPATAALEATADGYKVLLSGKYRGKEKTMPALQYSTQSGWEKAGSEACTFGNCVHEKQRCNIESAAINALLEAAEGNAAEQADYEDNVELSACVEDGDFVYFGLSSYRGEGRSGVGGIGRYHRQTGEMELRHPAELHEINVTHLTYDGHFLWIGTANQFECMGQVPEKGLLHYEWATDTMINWDTSSGMCGFTIRGLLLSGEQLVVASDTGISIRTPSPSGYKEWPTWRHFVPDLRAPGLMRETECDPLYDRLLHSVSQKDDGTGWSSFEQLVAALAKLQPYVLLKYVRAAVNGKTLAVKKHRARVK